MHMHTHSRMHIHTRVHAHVRVFACKGLAADSLTEEKVTMQQTEVEAGLFHIDITVDLRDVTESLLLKLLWNHPQV